MGNTSSADLAAWVASVVAALSWWTSEKARSESIRSTSGEGSRKDVAAEYRAQQEASRVELTRLLQRREENVTDSIADLERELLLSRQMTERDERLRRRLVDLQWRYRVQLEDRNSGRQCDSSASEGYHNPATLVAQGEPMERRRGREARRRDNSSTQSEEPSSTMVEDDRRPCQDIDTGRAVRRCEHENAFTLRASSR